MRIRRTRLYGASCTRTAGGPTKASDMVPMYGLRYHSHELGGPQVTFFFQITLKMAGRVEE